VPVSSIARVRRSGRHAEGAGASALAEIVVNHNIEVHFRKGLNDPIGREAGAKELPGSEPHLIRQGTRAAIGTFATGRRQ
jgi:hypothetical protein